MALTLGTLPVLRAGRPVLRRDERTLQVGIGAHPVLLRDSPVIAALLRRLDPTDPSVAERVDPADPEVRRALQLLEAAGHLVPRTAPTRRAAVGVSVLGPQLAERVAGLLETARLPHQEGSVAVRLLVSAGPLPRDRTDELVQSGVPHLVVSSTEGAWRVGPFVVPGTTACQRCVDAHESAADPRRGLLLEQAARHARDHPSPSDPLVELAALTWAVGDLRTYLDGGEPSTWSATVDLPAGPVVA